MLNKVNSFHTNYILFLQKLCKNLNFLIFWHCPDLILTWLQIRLTYLANNLYRILAIRSKANKLTILIPEQLQTMWHPSVFKYFISLCRLRPIIWPFTLTCHFQISLWTLTWHMNSPDKSLLDLYVTHTQAILTFFDIVMKLVFHWPIYSLPNLGWSW